MTEEKQYELVDIPFYRDNIVPVMPATVLDFHAHVWTSEQWRSHPLESVASAIDSVAAEDNNGSRYMVTLKDYTTSMLLADGRKIFPDNDYRAVFFGQPTPAVNTDLTNTYVAKNAGTPGLYPLIVTGRDCLPIQTLRQRITDHNFFGYKVFLDWIGDDYRDLNIADMIGPVEMELADELGLIVLLHVPGSRRLNDPDIQRSIREYSRRYANVRIVLAHCGRCYLPREMWEAIKLLRDLDNVYFDTAMVMDPSVLHILLDNVDSSRVLFATDFPVATMRGRRTYAADHWVDLVSEGYPPSAFRVCSSNFMASFMAYEIVLAIRMGAEMAGLSRSSISNIFFNNGMAVLRHVNQGRQLASVSECWAAKV